MNQVRSQRQLIFLRHGITAFNAQGRMQGQLDTPLLPEGFIQAQLASIALTALNPCAIYSSDLIRAADTAAALAERTGLTVNFDTRLRETGLGQWEGLTHREVDANWPGARQLWRDNADIAPPDGESRVMVAQRGTQALADITERYAQQWNSNSGPLIVVAHGGFIAAMTASLLGLIVPNWNVFDGLSNTGWVELNHYFPSQVGGHSREYWRLSRWNGIAGQAINMSAIDRNSDPSIL